MSPVPSRKPAAAAAPVVEGVDFLSRNSPLYTGSFVLPAGDWAVWFDIIVQQPKENSTFNKSRLGVRLSCINLDKPNAEAPVEQFLSFGSKAHESFMPSEDGKSLVPIVGGPGTLTNKSNWNLFRDSLYNAGLDDGILTNDFSVLDGIWLTTGQEAEPEERKGFGGSETGEVAQTGGNKGNGKIPVVIAIIEGGKPWEGGGGLPAEAPAAPAKPAARAVPGRPVAAPAKPAPAARPAPARVPVAAPATDAVDEDAVTAAAVNAVGTILGDEKYANGCPKLILKTGVFKAVTTSDGKAMAQAVTDAYFKTDDLMVALLDQIDYQLVGTTVKPK